MLISLNQFKIFCHPVRGGGRGCGGTRGGGVSRHPDCTHLGARNQKTAAPLGVAVGGAVARGVAASAATQIAPTWEPGTKKPPPR